MSEQSELASAIRENTEAIRDLHHSINTLTGRVEKLDCQIEKQEQAMTALTATMERIDLRLASKLDAGEMTEFVQSTNRRVKRIEQHLELASQEGKGTHHDETGHATYAVAHSRAQAA